MKELEKRSETQMNIGKKNRIWDESFYLLVLPALPVVLWWFRRGYVFSTILAFFIPFLKLDAATPSSYFKNSEELGQIAMNAEDYETATQTFKDPYRLGVAYYKAGNFAKAEEMFLLSAREEVALGAAYNLGNALAMQQKYQEAIDAYEEVLKKWPDCTKAKDNLELVKTLLKEQEEDPDEKGDESKKSDSDDSQDKEQKSGENPSSSGKPEQQKNSNKNSKSDDSQKKEPSESEGSEKQKSLSKDGEEDKKPQDTQDLSELEESQEKDSLSENSENKSPQELDGGQEEATAFKSQEDLDADLWLNQISNDPKTFLKNKFYIESKNNGTTKGIDPW